MRSFKQFVKEETMPYAGTASGAIDIRDSAVRDGLNQQLAGVTAGKFITPYIAFERVCKALANFHIFPPRTSFLEGDSGAVHFRIDQFGSKIGMNDDGQVVVNPELPFYLYFEYRQSDCGMFMIFSEVIDQDELDEIMDDIEEEMNEDDVAEDREEKLDEEKQPALPETGSRKTPGSNQPVITTGVTIPSELEGSNRDKMKSKLEKKNLEELNMSDEQQMDDKKLDEEQLNELSKKTVNIITNAKLKAAGDKLASRRTNNNVKDNNDLADILKKTRETKEPKKPAKENPVKLREGGEIAALIIGAKKAKENLTKKDTEDKSSKKEPDAWDKAAQKAARDAASKAKKVDTSTFRFKKIDEVSAELVGKVNKARLEKPSKTAAADETRGKAVKKAWLASKVGKLKKKD